MKPTKQRTLSLLLFINLVSLIGYYSFTPLYALFAKSFGLSPSTIGLLWSGYSFAAAICILLMGKLENKRAKGKALVLGYLLCTLGGASFLLVNDQQSLMLALLLNALGAGISLPAHKTLFAKYEVKGKESEEWSWFDAGTLFAAAIGAGVGSLLVHTWGFTGLFVGMAVIQGLATVAAYKMLYLTK